MCIVVVFLSVSFLYLYAFRPIATENIYERSLSSSVVGGNRATDDTLF